MQPPRWFWIVLACCLVLVSAAAFVRLRFSVNDNAGVMDLWRQRYCAPGACLRMGDTLPPHPLPHRSALDSLIHAETTRTH